MRLCVDIGNTNIVHASWDNNDFDEIKRVKTGKCNLEIHNKEQIKSIAITSVVPELTNYYQNYFKTVYNINNNLWSN